MKVNLPLVSLNVVDTPPTQQRAAFAANVTGLGRVDVMLGIAGWEALGRPTALPVELPDVRERSVSA